VSEEQELEELVETYLLARARGEKDALERLAAAYPAHEHALTRMALLLATAPADPGEHDLQAARSVLSSAARTRALAAARAGVTRAQREPVQTVEALPGLLSRAKALGLQARSVAAAVGLPRDILLELDQRAIAPASVPARLIAALATTLRTNAESVRAYLAGGAPQQAAAFHYAPVAPEPPAQRSFAQALEESTLASPEQRATWEKALQEDGLL
jgi:hypothetical protein